MQIKNCKEKTEKCIEINTKRNKSRRKTDNLMQVFFIKKRAVVNINLLHIIMHWKHFSAMILTVHFSRQLLGCL